MLAQIRADLVERAGGDLGAVAQARHQLAVIDEAAEGRFRSPRRAAKFPDLAEDLLRGATDPQALLIFHPHGCSPRFPFPNAIKEQAMGSVNHKASGQDSWASAHKCGKNYSLCLSMIFSENRFPLFGIILAP